MKRIVIIGMVVLLSGLMSALPALAQPGNGKGKGQPGQSEYGGSSSGYSSASWLNVKTVTCKPPGISANRTLDSPSISATPKFGVKVVNG